MANALFDPGREGFLDGTIIWSSGNIKVSLVRGYTFTASHKFLSDVTGAGGTLVATSSNLASKTVTNGIADAADITYTAVAAGAAITSLVGYQDTGTPATTRLIFFLDSATGLPVTPNGGDISVAWDNGSNKIFKL